WARSDAPRAPGLAPPVQAAAPLVQATEQRGAAARREATAREAPRVSDASHPAGLAAHRRAVPSTDRAERPPREWLSTAGNGRSIAVVVGRLQRCAERARDVRVPGPFRPLAGVVRRLHLRRVVAERSRKRLRNGANLVTTVVELAGDPGIELTGLLAH